MCMIQAVIFDMDGLLVDTEPLWMRTELRVLEQVGVTPEEYALDDTTGMRTDETVDHWYKKHPWKSPSIEAIEKQIDATIIRFIDQDLHPKKGGSRSSYSVQVIRITDCDCLVIIFNYY
jgi:beta-phosphoglucomutase-like phosphatase (HAD superfamily)